MVRKDESPSFGRFHVGLAVFCPRSDRKSTEKRTFLVFLGMEQPLGEKPILETASHRPGTARSESTQKPVPCGAAQPPWRLNTEKTSKLKTEKVGEGWFFSGTICPPGRPDTVPAITAPRACREPNSVALFDFPPELQASFDANQCEQILPIFGLLADFCDSRIRPGKRP